MKEYIEREAALAEIKGQPPELHYPSWYAGQIEEIPAVDVRPVIHGYWQDNIINFYCSKCGERGAPHWKYCPGCGADML